MRSSASRSRTGSASSTPSTRRRQSWKPHLKHLPLSERASNVVRACARSRRELRVISREARAAGEPDDTVDAALARFDALPRPNDAVWQHETVPDADAAAYLAYDAGDDDDDDDGGGEAARRDP